MERNTIAARLEALEKLQELDGDKETLQEARKCIQHLWIVVEMYNGIPEHVYTFRHKDTAQAKARNRKHRTADDTEFYILPGE